MAKVTVSLPEELVEQIDRLADSRGESRSLIVREAATAYVTLQQRDAHAKRRKQGTERALTALEKLRSLPGVTGEAGSEILRQIRDTDDGEWETRGE